jgi:spore coat polysaccharide biosynthesis protein SpsF
MRVAAIVQARMSSTRLPGKVLKPLGNLPASRTAIGQVLHQLSFAKRVNAVAVATSVDASDDELAEWAERKNIPCLRGSLNDVLDRYYTAAQTLGLQPNDAVVRITGDCPLLDPRVVDAVVACCEQTGMDYCSNVNPPSFPDGLDVEVMRFAALERAWKEAKLASEREHVTPYIRNHTELFTQANVNSPQGQSLAHHRWTLDTPEDYEFLRHVVSALEQPDTFITMQSVLALLEARPELTALNGSISRNEGYAASLKNDTRTK